MNEELISRLIKVRKSLNLNQTEFAKEIGVAPSSVSDMERRSSTYYRKNNNCNMLQI